MNPMTTSVHYLLDIAALIELQAFAFERRDDLLTAITPAGAKLRAVGMALARDAQRQLDGASALEKKDALYSELGEAIKQTQQLMMRLQGEGMRARLFEDALRLLGEVKQQTIVYLNDRAGWLEALRASPDEMADCRWFLADLLAEG